MSSNRIPYADSYITEEDVKAVAEAIARTSSCLYNTNCRYSLSMLGAVFDL